MLGIFEPLLGSWRAKTDSPMGDVVCIRTFTKALEGACVQLCARWEYEKDHTKKQPLSGQSLVVGFAFGPSLRIRSNPKGILLMSRIFTKMQ